MSVYIENIEREIEQKKQALEKLIRKKENKERLQTIAHERIMPVIDEAAKETQSSRAEVIKLAYPELLNSLTLEDLEQIVNLHAPQLATAIIESKKYSVVMRRLTGDIKTVTTTKTTEPKLLVGVYRNPHTGEAIEKIKRNPKPLDQWIEEYGFDTVAGWKQ